jgi:hypothetical protein
MMVVPEVEGGFRSRSGGRVGFDWVRFGDRAMNRGENGGRVGFGLGLIGFVFSSGREIGLKTRVDWV